MLCKKCGNAMRFEDWLEKSDAYPDLKKPVRLFECMECGNWDTDDGILPPITTIIEVDSESK